MKNNYQKRKCKKISYPDKIAAQEHLSRIKNKEQENQVKPVRAYECPLCGKWHLTHKELFRSEEVKTVHLVHIDAWNKLLNA